MENILYLETVKQNINIISEQLKKNGKTIDNLSEENIIELFFNILSKQLSEFNANYMDIEINNFQKTKLIEYQDNIDHLEEIWGSAFAYYSLFINFYIDFSDSFTELIKMYGVDVRDDDYVLSSLRFLNGRSIQIANGILVSLRNGYPDDGYARNRTLYEMLITMSFIIEHGDNVAKAFINYTGNWYHWAKSAINKPKNNHKIVFADLEKNCGLEESFITKWKEEQKDMHKIVHASPQGTFKRVGGYMKNSIPIGPTDTGIDLVAVNTIRLLNAIFVRYLSCAIETDDLITNMLIKSYFTTLKDIADRMEKEFSRLKKENFDTIKENIND